tara:strand:+ start:291 stop:668 length:378 start_codon:yes stop_codon:yes gene_type:complete
MAFVMSALTTAMPTVGVRGNVRVAPKAPAQAVSLVGSMSNGSVSLGREGECSEALISPPGTARWRRTRASSCAERRSRVVRCIAWHRIRRRSARGCRRARVTPARTAHLRLFFSGFQGFGVRHAF